jgi:hypothetical protein
MNWIATLRQRGAKGPKGAASPRPNAVDVGLEKLTDVQSAKR